MLRRNKQEPKLKITEANISCEFETKRILPKMDNITKNLQDMNCKIIHIFGLPIGNENICRYMLISTKQGHEVMLILPDIVCEKVIMCLETQAVISPDGFRQECLQLKAKLKVDMCILSHVGIDVLGGTNGKFNESERVIQHLNRGTTFYQALPLVEYENFTSDDNCNTIYQFIQDDSDTSLFKNILSKSSIQYLLHTDERYTVYVPSNVVLSQKFGRNLSALPKLNSYINNFSRAHIFAGTYAPTHTGEIVNLNNEKIMLNKGKIVVNNKAIDEYEAHSKINGEVKIIKGILPLPNDQNGYINSNDMQKINKVCPITLADITYMIWKMQKDYHKNIVMELRKQLNIISNSLDVFENETKMMEDTGDKLTQLDLEYMKIYHDTNNKQELDNISSRIKSLSNKYEAHVKNGASLIGAELALQTTTKQIRNIK